MRPITRLRLCLAVFTAGCVGLVSEAAAQTPSGPSRLKVFLDCSTTTTNNNTNNRSNNSNASCFAEFLREEANLVEYVREPAEADVHVIVTASTTGGGGRERVVSFIGNGRFKGTDRALKALSESGDTEDTERRRLAAVLKIGLLGYMAQDGVSTDLEINVEQASARRAGQPETDPWNKWVISVQGSVSTQVEETNRELQLQGRVGADRITDTWKLTTGLEIDYRREDFDLDEDEPLRAIRSEREFDGLLVRSLGEHWSFGTFLSIDSSSFENIALRSTGGAAIEYNFFPYSSYTRRQLRVNYAIGPYRARYVEETLLGKTEETTARQQASMTLDRREPWGSLRSEFEVSTFLPQWSKYRLEVDGQVDVRIARGLSFTLEGSASRIRDQLSLPRRGATPEEVLTRVRRLGTGYEFQLEVGLRYTFGSIFSPIVNPRFGQ